MVWLGICCIAAGLIFFHWSTGQIRLFPELPRGSRLAFAIPLLAGTFFLVGVLMTVWAD